MFGIESETYTKLVKYHRFLYAALRYHHKTHHKKCNAFFKYDIYVVAQWEPKTFYLRRGINCVVFISCFHHFYDVFYGDMMPFMM